MVEVCTLLSGRCISKTPECAINVTIDSLSSVERQDGHRIDDSQAECIESSI